MKKAVLLLGLLISTLGHTASDKFDSLVKPVMQKNAIAGMAIAVSVNGKHEFYNYGVMSKETKQAVNQQTLFEIGSVSKTFTATLASYAANTGKLSLKAPVSQYLPELKGSALDQVSLLNLGTHTSGLTLFVPDEIKTRAQLMEYYRQWKPEHPIGSYRVYSNLGIGLLGLITAEQMGQSFQVAMEKTMLPALGMNSTYIKVPERQMPRYAQGYNQKEEPVRVNPGMLDAEAYGIKSSAEDLIRYLDIQMQLVEIDPQWQKAVDNTHTTYFKASTFYQALMWEYYPHPVQLSQMKAGNAPEVLLKGVKATPVSADTEVQGIYNKTGSTNGFGTYILFAPAQKIAIVILTNKTYPNTERIALANKILMKEINTVQK
jgi:beta-lactamase class C